MPDSQWPDDERVKTYISNLWSDPFGDRRQEIVFIGSGIDWPTIKAGLDNCLIAEDAGNDLSAFAQLPDPFPVWRRGAQAA